MSEAAHPRRITVLVGLALALLLAVAYAVASWSTAEPGPRAGPAPPPPFPTVAAPTPTRTPHTPEQGSAYPVRRLGALSDRSVIVDGHANADLRYRRAPGNGTRVHFICTGC